jgi:hypothetical protein
VKATIFIFLKFQKYAKICKIVLFDTVEYESYFYPDPYKIESIEQNIQYHKHPNPNCEPVLMNS